jgi:hypothetical protein
MDVKGWNDHTPKAARDARARYEQAAAAVEVADAQLAQNEATALEARAETAACKRELAAVEALLRSLDGLEEVTADDLVAAENARRLRSRLQRRATELEPGTARAEEAFEAAKTAAFQARRRFAEEDRIREPPPVVMYSSPSPGALRRRG